MEFSLSAAWALAMAGLVLAGCPGGGSWDDIGAPPGDSSGDLDQGPAMDMPGAKDGAKKKTDGPRDLPIIPEQINVCMNCLKQEICVHFVNDSCKVVKRQCKYRTPACFSPQVNPCGTCEIATCGYYYSAKSAKCSMPVDGGAHPSLFCYCFSK